MALAVYLALALTAAFGLTAPVLAGRLPPAVATWLLSAGGLLAAAASSAALALLAFPLIAQSPGLAALGRWSDAALRHHDPVRAPVAALATAAVALLAARLARATGRRLVAVRAAYRMAAALPAPTGELTVLDTPHRLALAVPGRPGRVVITTGLLRRLDPGQRRAVLAHERSHLDHRHHVHHTVARLAAAASPVLGRLPAAVELSCERWADEDAAAVCPRDTVAGALSRAAAGAGGTAAVLAAAVTEVAARIGALQRPAPRLAVWRVVFLIGLLAATAAAVAEALHDTERLVDLAQTAYRAGQR